MSTPSIDDQDALFAAVDLIGRTGATQFEVGYLHDDVPAAEAGWWASARYRGAKILVEDNAGPIEACEALARRILTGGKCAHCGALTALSRHGAQAYKGGHLVDGTDWGIEEAAAAGQCLWSRTGDRWERGCIDSHPAPPKPNRAERRRRQKGRRR